MESTCQREYERRRGKHVGVNMNVENVGVNMNVDVESKCQREYECRRGKQMSVLESVINNRPPRYIGRVCGAIRVAEQNTGAVSKVGTCRLGIRKITL